MNEYVLCKTVTDNVGGPDAELNLRILFSQSVA
jgi:hypothetical protein